MDSAAGLLVLTGLVGSRATLGRGRDRRETVCVVNQRIGLHTMAVFCTKCGAQNDDYAQSCLQCGAALPNIGGYQPIQPPQPYGSGAIDWQKAGADKKLVAGICGILVGGFGIHKFILGYTTEGIIQIVLTFITCGIGHIIGLIEGIIYLTKTDEDFVRTYIQSKKGWF